MTLEKGGADTFLSKINWIKYSRDFPHHYHDRRTNVNGDVAMNQLASIQLNHLDIATVENLQGSFDNLLTTPHADGQYRLRRYSVLKIHSDDTIYEKMPQHGFTQSSEYNNFQGDVARSYEDLEDHIIEGPALKEIFRMFRDINHLPDGHEVEIHQMRVITLDDKTPVSPEGVHQDGYRRIGFVAINRHNIAGGNLLIYRERDGEPFINMEIQNGECVIVDDQEFWHSATGIKPIDPKEQGYMDILILTTK